ncbi:hypothetical protein IE53DRAFT_135372 [Violaceomyces palustris]|uniref:Uncharacterized protein n=1 Tax=Violaceomyces palustris TaxID=1673888 RepID=A0ACD0NV69_9BASI|nr:hypothetical protein IE53DRAFT_135372 [Violaceomyces palustris]
MALERLHVLGRGKGVSRGERVGSTWNEEEGNPVKSWERRGGIDCPLSVIESEDEDDRRAYRSSVDKRRSLVLVDFCSSGKVCRWLNHGNPKKGGGKNAQEAEGRDPRGRLETWIGNSLSTSPLSKTQGVQVVENQKRGGKERRGGCGLCLSPALRFGFGAE